MAIKLEKVVEKFYQNLEEGKITGRKCFACSTFDPIDIPEMLANLQM